MIYNLKITDYPDNIQVSFYENKIIRSKNDETDIKNDKYCIGDNLQNYWYNSETCQMEVIPKGYKVEINPFDNTECLIQYKSDDEIEKEHIVNIFRSLRRTKQNIYEIARGSIWDLFITLTIADSDIRFDIDKCKKYIGKRINKIRERYSKNLQYLIIFEKHPNSGAYHCHGLLKGIDGLTLNKAYNPHTGELIIKRNKQVYNIKEFDCIGFSTATFVESNNKITQYILKYISKDIAFEYPNKKAYLCSKGLPRGNEVLLDIERESDMFKELENYLGYMPELTHFNKGFNIYSGGEIKYLQFKKEINND